jgi:aminoglycoside phosphotransferase (APT) family kinase protein
MAATHSGKAPADEARPARAGEELDLGALNALFDERLPAYDGGLEASQFPSGHSNLTYLVSWMEAGHRVERVLRRPPFGNQVKTAHDMGREFRILSMLSSRSPSGEPWLPQAPRPILHVEGDEPLGAPFYVMERIAGTVLRRKLPAGLVLDEATNARMADAFVDQLVALHALPWETIGLGAIAKPEGYVERQVTGWTKRWVAAKTDEVPDVEAVAAWLAASQPPSQAPSLIHNDFKYDNLVLDRDDLSRIVGILDWEMATVGDPLMDLGTTLAYWVHADDPPPIVQFAFGPTHLPGAPRRADIAARYAEKTGRSLDHIRFYYAFALFKNAVVAQQIYARFVRGLTKDERFAAMGFAVQLLGAEAKRVVDGGGL